MKYLFTIHPEARQEVLDTIKYLKQHRTGYGNLFNLRVDDAIDKILTHPSRYPEIHKGSRRHRILLGKPFHKTHSIYYDFDGNFVRIISVFNNSRSETLWQERK